MRDIDKIIIHCSATYNHMDVGAEWIDKLHKSFGWKGIGYHFVIRRDGSLELGRDISAVGSHAKGHNASSIGVCWIGGLSDEGRPEDNRTHHQKKAMLSLVNKLLVLYPEAEVLGHRDLPGVSKACPCFDVKSWLEDARAEN